MGGESGEMKLPQGIAKNTHKHSTHSTKHSNTGAKVRIKYQIKIHILHTYSPGAYTLTHIPTETMDVDG